MLVAPKHDKKIKNKKNKNHNRNVSIKNIEKKSFQQKCTEYTVNGDLISQLRQTKKKLDSLYRPSYHAKWKSLHHFWVEWNEYAENLLQKYKDKKNGIDDMDDENKFDDLTVQQEINLEDDADDFLQKFEETMDELLAASASIRTSSIHPSNKSGGTFDKFVKKTTDRTLRDFKMEDPTKKYKSRGGRGHISASYEHSKGNSINANKLGISTTPIPFSSSNNKAGNKSRSYSPTPDMMNDIDNLKQKQIQLVELNKQNNGSNFNINVDNMRKVEELR
eukprot:187073_1